MIDPLTPSTTDRLAALRKPAQKRRKPAYNSKILTAGISATALFAMVTAMGWQASVGSAQTTTQAASASDAVAPVVQVVPAMPVAALPAAVPVIATPVAAPSPVVIPVAVPVAQLPVQATSGGAASNTATKASG
jgi:hypothetical protein